MRVKLSTSASSAITNLARAPFHASIHTKGIRTRTWTTPNGFLAHTAITIVGWMASNERIILPSTCEAFTASGRTTLKVRGDTHVHTKAVSTTGMDLETVIGIRITPSSNDLTIRSTLEPSMGNPSSLARSLAAIGLGQRDIPANLIFALTWRKHTVSLKLLTWFLTVKLLALPG
jgi:hypothetical protein